MNLWYLCKIGKIGLIKSQDRDRDRIEIEDRDRIAFTMYICETVGAGTRLMASLGGTSFRV